MSTDERCTYFWQKEQNAWEMAKIARNIWKDEVKAKSWETEARHCNWEHSGRHKRNSEGITL